MSPRSRRVRGAIVASILGGGALVTPSVALAESGCTADVPELARPEKSWAPEFKIARDGEASRRRLLATKGNLEVEGKPTDTYLLRVEQISHRTGQPVENAAWCNQVHGGEPVTLPLDKVKAPDYLRVSVFGEYDSSRDEAAREGAEARELPKEAVDRLVRQWTRHTLRQMSFDYPLPTLVGDDARLTQTALELKAAIAASFVKGAPCQQEKQSVQLKGMCHALVQVSQDLLQGNAKSLDARKKDYDKVFSDLPPASDKEEFCTAALRANAVQRPETLDSVLLSINELPVTDPEDTYDLVFGTPEQTANGAAVGVPVVTWIRKVPPDAKPKVTWTVDDLNVSSDLKPLAQMLGTIVKLAQNASVLNASRLDLLQPDAKALFSHTVPFVPFSADEPAPSPESTVLGGKYSLQTYCASTQNFPLPVMASRVSRVHVAEPLRGYKAYQLRACAGETGCADKEPDKKLRAQAMVHTRADSWRMTLSLGFNYNQRLSDRQFQDWRWRAVGSTTGAEQLYQYSRTSDPLGHASASLMLTFLSPTYVGPGQLGVAVGPSLLIGTRLQPLRQWNLNGVWALRQGLQFTGGLGVRFEDVPMEPGREGELQLVARSAGAAPPDIDQRRAPAWMVSAGFALDLAFLADGGSALLKEMGVGQ